MFTVGLRETSQYQEVEINDIKFSTFKGRAFTSNFSGD